MALGNRTNENKINTLPTHFLPMAAAGFASMVSMRLCDAMLPALATDFSTTTGRAAGVISYFVIAYGVLQLVYGAIGARIGKPRLIALAATLSMGVNLALALAGNLDALFILRAVAGGIAAAIIPTTLAHLGDTVPYEQRQPVLANYMSATITGGIIGQWTGGILTDTLGWPSAFLLMTLVFGVAAWSLRALLFQPIQRPADGVPSGFLAQIAGTLSGGWARLIITIVFFEGAIVFSGIVFIPSYLHNQFNVPLTWAGAIVALYGIGGLGYTFFARRLLARFGEQGLAVGGGAMMGLGFILLVLGNHWAWSLPSCLASGFGFYMMHNTLQTNATQMAPQTRGTAVALFASSLFLGQAVGIAAVAAIIDQFGPIVAFAISAASLPLLGWLFSVRLRKRRHGLASTQSLS